MSARMHGIKLNSLIVHKQEFVVYKVVKQFRPYLMKNHCMVFILHQLVQSLLVQQELGKRRAN